MIFTPTPTHCDICRSELGSVMYDAKTVSGMWGCLCPSCWRRHTQKKLGVGFGQKYRRQSDNLFHKVE
jgi:hypothetical protein